MSRVIQAMFSLALMITPAGVVLLGVACEEKSTKPGGRSNAAQERFDAGYKARKSGVAAEANPYVGGETPYSASVWLEGWVAANDEIKAEEAKKKDAK